MATEEVAPNPSAMAAHKAVDEAFPVCRVLGVLQRNGHLSEQSLPPKEPHEHQENRDFINQSTTQSEEIVSESPPSQVDEVSQETDLSKGELLGSLPCPKCGKTFPSGTSLRSHLADISLCESQPVVLRTEGGKMESKSCFKCGKTFASWQGLRGHLNRVKPCDQEKPAPPTTRRRPAASRTCAKCGKTFSSPQSLRIHMNRVKPCDQDKNSVSTPTTPPAATQPTPTLLMNAEDLKKEAERKAKARYQARKAYLKKRGRLGELGAPPSTLSGDGHNGPNETVSKPDLKRSATDEISQAGENVDSANVEAKRQRVQEEASSEELSIDSPSDVSGLTQPTPPSSIPPQKTLPMGGSFVHRSSKGHGGDLLAGGCSCPPCVRRWARKLMNRMQQLEDEVLTLRKQNSTGVENATALDFRKQIDELRVSIAAEKSKRETTVAALIAHEWNPRRDEFKTLLESSDAVNYPNEEQAHHAKWSEISNQLSLKDKVISALESQMDCLGESGGSSRSRYAEMGELSSKMAAEYSAKMALARDREGIYLDLVKSNTRIRSLVKSTLF
uniref:C2H2-type domain-containing protein n=1 Tax=Phytophthora ramorum TaxID=164328 RepID=H3GHS8_PHYRM